MDQFTFFDEFNRRRKERLEKGVKKYGDGLFNQHDLVVDVEEELLDLANYAYLLYCRIKNIESSIDSEIRGKISGP
ncbi:MAG: hypothetical protein ACW99A_19965 [Candidatus Kariarchaeaceae archaeon]|jgi:hypothetical protein